MSGDGTPAAADVDRALRRLDLLLRRGRAQSRRAAARPSGGGPILPAQRASAADVQSIASRVTKP